jgi:hypothetical protein
MLALHTTGAYGNEGNVKKCRVIMFNTFSAEYLVVRSMIRCMHLFRHLVVHVIDYGAGLIPQIMLIVWLLGTGSLVVVPYTKQIAS